MFCFQPLAAYWNHAQLTPTPFEIDSRAIRRIGLAFALMRSDAELPCSDAPKGLPRGDAPLRRYDVRNRNIFAISQRFFIGAPALSGLCKALLLLASADAQRCARPAMALQRSCDLLSALLTDEMCRQNEVF